jgi:hypothetical protein
MNTIKAYGAGFVGKVMENGKVTIENCRSSVDIQSNEGVYNGGHSGFVSRVANGSTINIKDCVFDGGFNAAKCTQCAGFIGSIQDYQKINVTIENCLFAPTACRLAKGNAHRTFVRGTSNTITNSYYTQSLGGTQGAQGILLYDGGVPATANEGVIGRCINEQYDVKLQGRTLYKDGAWNTLCLPFDVSTASGILSGDGVQAMTLDTETSTLTDGTLTLNFTTAEAISAGTPFIIKWDNTGNNIVTPEFGRVTINAAKHDAAIEGVLTFTGTYAPVSIGGEDKTVLFLGSNNELYYPNSAMSIGSCRAYFQLDGLTEGELAAGVKAIRLNFDDSAATAIDAVNAGEQTTVDGAIYNLSGQRVSQPTKGIYIINGKKVMMK